ncbi:hypothetical protein B9Q06_03245 [Candidatus Marsarchaeota G2 archaeon ECH_B_2]|uniref:Uncharacterized protein n=3 Tax=Candidatus Marsarchaeota group 2 TaxID=2203771 RepID=A0A2R6BBZ9_9ARCH|nr:MAG: hypothetical protein B9Q06_03245 [Candidatus Marsarchaeota G2 archaeon ECH_B_2]
MCLMFLNLVDSVEPNMALYPLRNWIFRKQQELELKMIAVLLNAFEPSARKTSRFFRMLSDAQSSDEGDFPEQRLNFNSWLHEHPVIEVDLLQSVVAHRSIFYLWLTLIHNNLYLLMCCLYRSQKLVPALRLGRKCLDESVAPSIRDIGTATLRFELQKPRAFFGLNHVDSLVA